MPIYGRAATKRTFDLYRRYSCTTYGRLERKRREKAGIFKPRTERKETCQLPSSPLLPVITNSRTLTFEANELYISRRATSYNPACSPAFRGQPIKNLFMNAWQGLGTTTSLVGAYYRRAAKFYRGVSLCVSRRAICSTFFPLSSF